jgi:hypothetical protein
VLLRLAQNSWAQEILLLQMSRWDYRHISPYLSVSHLLMYILLHLLCQETVLWAPGLKLHFLIPSIYPSIPPVFQYQKY